MNGTRHKRKAPTRRWRKSREVWLSRTSSRAKEWKAVERVDKSMTVAPTIRPAGTTDVR